MSTAAVAADAGATEATAATTVPVVGRHVVSTDSSPPTNVPVATKVASNVAEGQPVQGSVAGKDTPAPSRCVLEDFTKCSESHLWSLMMSFYDRKGVESWSQGIVPHFITCNSFIGKSYAQVFQGFVRDCMRSQSAVPLDPSEPLYIIELGAGSGKFSYLMLKALVEMKDTLDFPVDKIVYVMTDFTHNNFTFWRDHPALAPYFEAGQLDSAIFNAVTDTSITLANSGKVLEPGNVTNPICVVANYLFDTLCHDIFQVSPPGLLKEGLISVGSKRAEEPDPLEPEIIKRFDNRFKYMEIDDRYYTHEGGEELHFERILHWYRDYFGKAPEPSATSSPPEGASILLPIGALRALRRLTAFSKGRCLVISGDKGNNNPDQFRGIMDPHIAVHGSFSVMVNYHAIGAYFTSRGGFALHNPQEEASLKVSAFVLPGPDTPETVDGVEDGCWTGASLEIRDQVRAKAFPNLSRAFVDNIETFGPNDFFVMQKSLKEDAPSPTLKAVVALLKLGDWDPDVFYKFRDVILNQVPTCGHKLRNDLCRGIPRVWANYYSLDKDKDVAFEIGRFYYGIRDYEKALGFYAISSETIGEHHVTYHNMGLCHYSMGNHQKSLTYFAKSLEINPQYEKATSWSQKVQKELEEAKSKNEDPQVEGIQSALGGGDTESSPEEDEQ